MKLLLIASACFPQENVAPTPSFDPGALPAPAERAADEEPAPPGEEAPGAEPWGGTFAEGMAEVVRLAASDEHQAALELTERLLAPDAYQRWRAELEEAGGLGARVASALDGPLTWLGLERLPARDRAEVRFARGLLLVAGDAVLDADRELDLARVLAGPGELRHDAVYALGLLDLARGEALRQKIPEVTGAAPTPGGPPGAGGEEESDPLELARQAYLEARAHLVERLRLDWRDEDARAAAELCVRRLRELDEIERRREEREQQQQQQQQQQDSSEEQQEQSEEQESEQEQDPQEQEPQQEEPSEEQFPEEEAEDEAEEARDEPPREMHLTEEQMKQLLELLRRHQEEGEMLEDRMRARRRPRTDRDW